MRTDYINFDQMFFGVAFWAAMRSKDPSTQCGACIARENKPLGFGYNGLINGFEDTPEIWGKEEKKKYVYHAEENAIRNSGVNDFKNAHIYIWTSNPQVYLPCERCARTISHYGFSFVHVLSYPESVRPENDTRWNTSLSLDLLKHAGVQIIEHNGKDINDVLLNCIKRKLSKNE